MKPHFCNDGRGREIKTVERGVNYKRRFLEGVRDSRNLEQERRVEFLL